MPANAWARPKRGSEAAKNHGFMDTYFPSNDSGGSSRGGKCRCKHKCTCKNKKKAEQSAMLLPDAPESSSSSSSSSSQGKKKPLMLEYDYSERSHHSQGNFEQYGLGSTHHSPRSSHASSYQPSHMSSYQPSPVSSHKSSRGSSRQTEFDFNHSCRK